MVHPIHRVVSFEIVAPYTLRVQFDDESEQTIDFQPMLAGELFPTLARCGAVQSSSNRSRSSHAGLAQRRRLRSCHVT